jgi:hypothetical protein
MMKRSQIGSMILTVGCVVFSAVTAQAQKFYKISLKDFKIDAKDINFTISEIIDARSDKNTIGIVQSGLNNKSTFATFESPGFGEVEQLLKNSGLYAHDGLSLRINVLKISENTTLIKETAKAELNIDFFIRHADLYYYISSVFTSAEPGGIDVTKKQAANIVTAIEKALVMFSQQKNEVDPTRSFSLEDLQDPKLELRDPSSVPILTSEKLNDGYFASFDEFLNNEPSISIDCRIKLSAPVRAICNEVTREVPTLYGFSHNNKLYILYHREFHELEKRNDTFYFYGPSKISKSPTTALATTYFGAMGIVDRELSGRGKYSSLYMLDIKTGMVRNITGF